MYIQVIDGVGIDKVGKSNTPLYGEVSVREVIEDLQKQINLRYSDVEIRYLQSNDEGEIISKLRECNTGECLGVVLNQGERIREAKCIAAVVKDISTTVVEIAMARERYVPSIISELCKGSIVGFGLDCYQMGVNAILLDNNM